jgi:hypothetical protein
MNYYAYSASYQRNGGSFRSVLLKWARVPELLRQVVMTNPGYHSLRPNPRTKRMLQVYYMTWEKYPDDYIDIGLAKYNSDYGDMLTALPRLYFNCYYQPPKLWASIRAAFEHWLDTRDPKHELKLVRRPYRAPQPAHY